MCGLQKGLSTLRFGGRKYGFHIFSRQRQEHRFGHRKLPVLTSSLEDVTTSWTTWATHVLGASVSPSVKLIDQATSGILQSVHRGFHKTFLRASQGVGGLSLPFFFATFSASFCVFL